MAWRVGKKKPNKIASFIYDNGSQPWGHDPLFALGHEAISKIGYLVQKSIFVQILAHPDAMTFYFYSLFWNRLKSGKKIAKYHAMTFLFLKIV